MKVSKIYVLTTLAILLGTFGFSFGANNSNKNITTHELDEPPTGSPVIVTNTIQEEPQKLYAKEEFYEIKDGDTLSTILQDEAGLGIDETLEVVEKFDEVHDVELDEIFDQPSA